MNCPAHYPEGGSPAVDRRVPVGAISGSLASSYSLTQDTADYHASLWAHSCSMLKPCLRSHGHYLHALTSNQPSSPAQEFGTLLHAAVLEPQTLSHLAAVFVGDPEDRRALRHFRKANTDRIVIALADYLALRNTASQVLESPFRGRSLGKYVEESHVEKSCYFQDPHTGLWCRVRPDLWHPEFTFDLKTTRHGGAADFQRHAVELHYDMQAYMYCLARCLFEGTEHARPFVVIQIESTSPHGVLLRPVSRPFLDNGMRKYESAIQTVVGAQQRDAHRIQEEVLTLEPWQRFPRR